MRLRSSARCLALACLALSPLHAAVAQTIKVGMAMDISGPFSANGTDSRTGYALAMKQLNGKLGGFPVEYIQTDTAGNPDNARQQVERMLQRDDIDLFTGPVASNVALAVGPLLFGKKVPYLSHNTGPSALSGKGCNAYFFGTAYQNDAYHEAAGRFATQKEFKKVVLIAPNYPGGKDAVNGFKHFYEKGATNEIYTKVGQIDYAAELAQLRSDKPDAVYFFLPGAMGIGFIKQFVAAGLDKSITLISTGFSADEDIVQAVGKPMLGIYNTSHWAHDLDVPANKAFVAAYRKEYGRYPSGYAAQAYDVIMAMNAAVKQIGGKVDDREALLAALRKADFESVRGKFVYGNNQFPIENFYLRVVDTDANGQVTNKLVSTILKNYQDSYADQCPLKAS
jgi:branched-chain amino acid transport system substrate-binding protein